MAQEFLKFITFVKGLRISDTLNTDRTTKLSMSPHLAFLDRDSIVEFLVERRKKLGLSQPILAERAGCDQSLVYRMEKGFRYPKTDTLDSFLGVLGCRHEYLPFGGLNRRAICSSELGPYLETLLNAEGLTAQNLEAVLGLGRGTVRQYFRRQAWRLKTLFYISSVFGIPGLKTYYEASLY